MFDWPIELEEKKEIDNEISVINEYYNQLGYIITENIVAKNISYFFDWECLDFKNDNDKKLLDFLISKLNSSLVNDCLLSYIFNNNMIDENDFTYKINVYKEQLRETETKSFYCLLKKNNIPIHIYTSMNFDKLYYIYPYNDISLYRDKSDYFKKIINDRKIDINLFKNNYSNIINTTESTEKSKKSKSIKINNEYDDNNIHIVTTYNPFQLTQKFYLNENTRKIKDFEEDTKISGLVVKNNNYYDNIIKILMIYFIKPTIINYINLDREKGGFYTSTKLSYDPDFEPGFFYNIKIKNVKDNETTYSIMLVIIIKNKLFSYIIYENEEEIPEVSYLNDILKKIKDKYNTKNKSNEIIIDKSNNIKLYLTKNMDYLIFNIIIYFCKYNILPTPEEIRLFNTKEYLSNYKNTIDLITSDFMKHYMRNIIKINLNEEDI